MKIDEQKAALRGYPLYPQGRVGKASGLQMIQFRARHPTKGIRTATLGTNDPVEAIALYLAMVPDLQREGFDVSAEPRDRDPREASHLVRAAAARARLLPGSFAEFAREAGELYADRLVCGKGKSEGDEMSERGRQRYKQEWAAAALHPEFQSTPCASLTVDVCRRYMAPLLLGNKPGAYRLRRAALSKLCTLAVDAGRMAENPVERTKAIPSRRRGRDLSADDLEKLLDVSRGYWSHVAALAYFTGGRPGAIAIMQAADVRQLAEPETHGPHTLPVGTWEIRVSALGKGGNTVLATFTPAHDGYTRLDLALRYLLAEREAVIDIRSRRWRHDVSPALIVHCAAAGSHKYIGCAYKADALGKRLIAYGAKIGIADFEARDLRAAAQTQATLAHGALASVLGHKTEAMRRHYVKRDIPDRPVDQVPGRAA